MSKLTELVNKGVRLLVTDAGPTVARDANLSRELPAELLDVEPPKPVERSSLRADADFAQVYAEAGIEAPLHGYGIDKVAEMLDNKRLQALAPEHKASAVLAALEAAGVAVAEVIQDAVKRDKALDAFEAAKSAELGELRRQTEARVSALRAELEALVQAKNGEIESLTQAADAAGGALAKLREAKRREEDRLHGLVAHFVEGAQNPITTAGTPAPAPKGA
jgi:hypothetical protein